MANFGKVRRAQLAISTLLTSSLVPLGSFQIFSGLFRCQRESGMQKQREATAPIKSLIKLQPWFLSLRWKTCLSQSCSLGFSACREGPVFGQNTDYDDDTVYGRFNRPRLMLKGWHLYPLQPVYNINLGVTETGKYE